MLNFAINTAREAGKIIAEKYGRNVQIKNKGVIDLVTEADLAAEQLIIERISSYYPRHAILAEESGKSVHQSEFKWLIDPLDGTTNFAHGYPCFCVSIALEHEGVLKIGVVYDPLRDELFAAERGEGATLNNKKIRVSETDKIERSLLCTGFPYNIRERGAAFVNHFINFLMTAQAVRRDGSAALDLAYVACGRFDGFWEDGLNPWDMAAGILLIEEAGGLVTSFDGSPVNIYRPPIIASNRLIHDAMMNVLNV
jgi:myo-inositol-1(or 4)-monophosphatase